MASGVHTIGFFSIPYTKLDTGECPVENYAKMCSGRAVFQVAFSQDFSNNVYVDINPGAHDGDDYMMSPPLNVCTPTPKQSLGFFERQIAGRILFVKSGTGWKVATQANMPPLRDAAGSSNVVYFGTDHDFRQCLRNFTGISDTDDTAIGQFLALTHYINLANMF